MKYNKKFTMLFLISSLLLSISACHNGKEGNKNNNTIDTIIKSTVKAEQKNSPNKAPVINITDTISIKHFILYMKDSAATSSRISIKLGEIYSVKLAGFIKKNGLKVMSAPMAWYRSQKAPFFFEAGIAVDKNPRKLTTGIFVKQIGTDSIVVAHFYGPYNLTNQAYPVLQDWIKDRKKKMIQPPYEIYIDDPLDKNGKLKDPYKVQTDIVFTWK